MKENLQLFYDINYMIYKNIPSSFLEKLFNKYTEEEVLSCFTKILSSLIDKEYSLYRGNTTKSKYLELISELAEEAVFKDLTTDVYREKEIFFNETFMIQDTNGDSRYNEEAQDLFNSYYSFYEEKFGKLQ